jgi:hypothetical protein
MSDDTAAPISGAMSGEPRQLEDLTEPPPPAPPPLSPEDLASFASGQLDRQITLRSTAALTLSARHPFDPAGLVDFYRPGRWDATSDMVYMTSDFAGDPSAGYAQFTAPATGSYLIAVRFLGYQTTLRVNGPWGTASAYAATTSDHPVVTALWDGAAAATLYFTFSLTGGSTGYLVSIEVRQLT